MNADLALKKLIQGNRDYVEASNSGTEMASKLTRAPTEEGQHPFAIILGCSDSRVPVETLFHQGFGDLFVIRVAGNIVAPSQIGSIEYACHNLGAQLVVVLGHSDCGAVSATVDSLLQDPDNISPNIASIIDLITPAVLPVISKKTDLKQDELLQSAMRANVTYSVNGLEKRSSILRNLVDQKQLKIVGAEYSIDTGKVDFHLS